MLWSHKKKGALCQICSVCSIVTMVLAALLTLAAIVGVYKAHVLSSGLVFGTSTGSFSIIALVASLALLKKAGESCSCQCELPTKKK